MKRILLTGARAPVTLDLVRHFHRAGHEVYLADSIHLPLARLTRFARRTFVVPKPAMAPRQFVEALAAIALEHKIDLVVPTCEEIFYIAARLSLFPSFTTVFSEPLEQLRVLHNKWTFAQSLQRLNLAVQAPETHLVTCPEELRLWILNGETNKWVFKPVYSRFASRTLIGPSPDQVKTIVPSAADPWVVQHRIVGTEFSTYSIAHRGKLRAHVCYRSKYRAGPGSGIYFLNVDEPRIREFVQSFVSQTNFSGQIGFDIMIGLDGHVYAIECNPRATSGLHLLAGQPVASAILDHDGPLVIPNSDRPAMLAAVMFLFPFPEAIWRWRLGAFFRDMLAARDVMFDWQDPLPALLSPVSLLEVMVTAIRTRQPLTRAATFDIEWNGAPI